MSTYKHSKIEQAAVILNSWIIENKITQNKCLNKIINLGISFEDADYMMDVCNMAGIKDCMPQIESFSEDLQDDEDNFYDHYNDYLRNESGVY